MVLVQEIRRSLFRVVAVPVLLLAVMLGLSLISIRVLTTLSNSVIHSREVETVAQDVLLQFVNMETGLRGYIASRDSVFLEPYWEGYSKLKVLLSNLDELSRGNSEHENNLAMVKKTLVDWYLYSERVRNQIARNPHYAPPPSEFLQHSGKDLMDNIRKNVSEIIQREEKNYNARALETRESVGLAMYSTLGLAILLGLLSAFYLRKEILEIIKEFSENLEENRKSREELKALNEGLEDAIKARTAQLEATNAELEAFCYSVSHDLRAPLRGIDGFSEALHADFNDHLPDEAKSYIKFIRQGVQRMGQLIDDLLTLSRLTRTETSIEELDLGEMVKDIEQEIQSLYPDRKVEFTGTPHLPIRGDRSLLRAAMTNLLSNAWKFTEKVPRAKITFGVKEEEGKKIFFVQDNGAGFDMAHSNKLFGAFQRLHSAKDFPGTGVGLATVRRIMRRHGGEVWAQGKPGEGATFYFTLGV